MYAPALIFNLVLVLHFAGFIITLDLNALVSFFRIKTFSACPDEATRTYISVKLSSTASDWTLALLYLQCRTLGQVEGVFPGGGLRLGI